MEQYIFLHPGSLELHISWQAPLYLIISPMPSVSLKSSLSLYWLVFSPLKVFYLNFLLVLLCGWWTEWDDCHMGQQQKEQCQNALLQLEKLKTKNEWKMETHQKQTHCPFLKNGCFSVIFHLIFDPFFILFWSFFFHFCRHRPSKMNWKMNWKMRTVNPPPLKFWKMRSKMSEKWNSAFFGTPAALNSASRSRPCSILSFPQCLLSASNLPWVFTDWSSVH